MSARRLLFATLALMGLLLIPLFVRAIPLGIPGEWTWQRLTLLSLLDLLLGLVTAVVVGGVYLAVVRGGTLRLREAERSETSAWLLGLVCAGFAWLWFVQEIPPAPFGLGKSPLVLYLPASSGYFFEARYEIANVDQFLRGYEARMREGDVLHVGTHPPGLFLLHRGLINLCEASPGISQLVQATIPHSARETIELIERDIRLRPEPLGLAGTSALWLAVLLTQCAASLAVVPLYLLLRIWHDRRTCWLTASFWPLFPAVAIFLPKSDALFPLLGLTFAWLWISGLQRNSLVYCAAAGLVFWFGMTLSLALLPIGLFAGLLTLRELWRHVVSPRKSIKNQSSIERTCPIPSSDSARNAALRFAGMILAGAAGFLLPALLLWSLWGCNLFVVWPLNYENHAGFYSQYSRTYWKWLLVNPLELAIAVGPAVIILAMAAGVRLFRRVDISLPGAAAALSALAVVILLWISGKNSGEAARLWLIVDPLLLVLGATQVGLMLTTAASAASSSNGRESGNGGTSRRGARDSTLRAAGPGKRVAPRHERGSSGTPSDIPDGDCLPRGLFALLVVQMCHAALVVSRVTGFDFPGV